MLGIPLLREGIPIGVIALTRGRVAPFTDKQIELVTTFADQAVIAIENVRLFDEVQARTRDLSDSLQQQTATAEVLKVISRSAFNLQAVLELAQVSICVLQLGGGALAHQSTRAERIERVHRRGRAQHRIAAAPGEDAPAFDSGMRSTHYRGLWHASCMDNHRSKFSGSDG
jgi:GAF domain-containing protein